MPNNVYDSVAQLIGKTPLVRINNLVREKDVEVFAKLESYNPGGSVKDRIALNMIVEAQKNGLLKKGSTIIEASSGNTGAAIAMLSNVFGYKCKIVVSDRVMSREKVRLLENFGAEIITAPAIASRESPEGYVGTVKRLLKDIPNSVYLDQYNNEANPEAHYSGTGKEIYEQTQGRITHFVTTIGTGGTISGVGKYLKERNPSINVIGVDPIGSVIKGYFDKGELGDWRPYQLEAIGQDFLPNTLNLKYVNQIVQVGDGESLKMSRDLAMREGISAGWSSGAAMLGVKKYLENAEQKSGLTVVLFPDSSTGYLSKITNLGWQMKFGLGFSEFTVDSLLKELFGDSGPPTKSINYSASVSKALMTMVSTRQNQISVTRNKEPIGYVTLERLTSLVDADSLMSLQTIHPYVSSAPVVEPATTLSQAFSLIRQNKVVIVKISQSRFACISNIEFSVFVSKLHRNLDAK